MTWKSSHQAVSVRQRVSDFADALWPCKRFKCVSIDHTCMPSSILIDQCPITVCQEWQETKEERRRVQIKMFTSLQWPPLPLFPLLLLPRRQRDKVRERLVCHVTLLFLYHSSCTVYDGISPNVLCSNSTHSSFSSSFFFHSFFTSFSSRSAFISTSFSIDASISASQSV